MPAHQWVTPFTDAVKALGVRDPEAEALASWAVLTVEEIHYLYDLDASGIGLGLGHHSGIVERAHARWAIVAAVTALDQCAAALGRHYGLQKAKHELDLKELIDPQKTIPGAARAWGEGVSNDTDYQLVLSARNSLTHKRLPRSLYVGSSHPTELWVEQDGHEVRVKIPDLIWKATEVATRHVENFLAEAKAGRF